MRDLISRADAIEAVIEYWDGYAKPLDSWDVMNQTRAVLETLPSAVCDDCIWTVCNYNKVDWNAPSAEAKGDLISRQDAVNTIKRYKHRLEGKGQTYGFLLEEFEHQIPSASAEAVQGWIQCSERLPKDSGDYLVWLEDESEHYAVIPFDADAEGFGWWQDYYHPISLGFLDSEFIKAENVTAWQPLPEPYKGGDDTTGESL